MCGTENRLTSVTVNGQYIQKVQGGQTTAYVGNYYEYNVNTGVATSYYYAGSTRVAMRQGGVVSYLHADHLGSASLTTDANGAPTSQLRYLPYGAPRPGYPTGNVQTDYRFTGQRSEEASLGSLYDYGARMYSPVLGRFLSADTLVPSPGNPQSLNRYSYVLNNPIKYVDPTGHMAFTEGGGFCDVKCIETAANLVNTPWSQLSPQSMALFKSAGWDKGAWLDKRHNATDVAGTFADPAFDVLLVAGAWKVLPALGQSLIPIHAGCATNPVCGSLVLGITAEAASGGKQPSQLLRWVHPNNLQPNGDPKSLAFRDPEMSVFDTALGATPERVLDVMSKGSGQGAVYAMDASKALQVDGVTRIAQKAGETGDRILDAAHLLIYNPGTKSVAKALRDIAELVLRGGP
jgi:RHS repeat-associated protein